MEKYKSGRILGLLDVGTFWLLNVGLVVLILFFATFIVSWFEDFSVLPNFEWPVLFSDHIQNSLVNSNEGVFSTPHSSDFNAFNGFSAALSPRSHEWPFFNFYSFITILFKYSMILGIINLFRNVILDIKHQPTFSLENISRLKYIAVILFAFFPYALLDSMISHWYIINYVEMHHIEFISRFFYSDVSAQEFLKDHQVLLSNKRDTSTVFYAMIVYVLALIFQEGLKLKQDNNSIV